MSHPLDGCRERFERAKEHFELLDSEWLTWKRAAHEFVVEYDPDSGWHIFRTKYFDPPPLRLGVIASDYLHQLRATLDNLVCALAEMNGVTCGKHHRFPTTLDRANWRSDSGSMLKGLRRDHIAEIATVQPYTASYDPIHHPFAALDALNRLDKHRFLTPTALSFADSTPEVVVGKPGIALKEVLFRPGTPLETDGEFLRVSTEPCDEDPQLQLQSDLGVHISFGERPIRQGNLKRIGMAVNDVISRSIFQS